MYFHNVGVSYFRDIWRVGGIYLLLGAVLFAGYALGLRSSNKGAICASITVLLFAYFALIEAGILKIVPSLYYWHVALLVLFVLGHIVWLIGTKTKGVSLKKANILILGIFAGLILVNFAMAAPTIVRKVQSATTGASAADASNTAGNATDKKLPNVYFLIFDEYGGFENLQRYCDYDNSAFYDQLERLGFNVSKASHGASSQTIVEVPNLLNLEYVNIPSYIDPDTPDTKRLEKLKNPYLYQLLREKGYTLNIADAWNFLDNDGAKYFMKSEYSSMEGTSEYYTVQNSAFYPFYKYVMSAKIEELENLHSAFNYIIFSSKLQSNNLFTIGYYLAPHPPWFVDENGHAIDVADRYNVNANPYLGQLKYVNKKIVETVEQLILNDPNCVIMLMSDHGYRKPAYLGLANNPDNIKEFNTELYFMSNTLNAVYYQDETMDIEDLSNMNTLIGVLNKLLTINEPLQEYPDYAKFIDDYREKGIFGQ
jgi:hypothetical protein